MKNPSGTHKRAKLEHGFPEDQPHPVTPALVAYLSPYMRRHILRFGRYALDMGNLPDRLNPQPLPFEPAL